MAARNTTITLTAGAWSQLTDNDVTAATVANNSDHDVWVALTAGETPPTSTATAMRLVPGAVLDSATTLAQWFPGVSGGNRLYAFSRAAAGVFISHGA